MKCRIQEKDIAKDITGSEATTTKTSLSLKNNAWGNSLTEAAFALCCKMPFPGQNEVLKHITGLKNVKKMPYW